MRRCDDKTLFYPVESALALDINDFNDKVLVIIVRSTVYY